MTSRQITRLLEDHDIEERSAPDEEVASYWRKGLRAYRDSRVPGLSPHGAFNAAYEAALDAATALVREAGYRVNSHTRHHWAAFYAVEGLGDPELDRLGSELNGTRTNRHHNVYGSDDDQETAVLRRDRLHHLLGDFLPAAHRVLLARRPALRDVLEEPR